MEQDRARIKACEIATSHIQLSAMGALPPLSQGVSILSLAEAYLAYIQDGLEGVDRLNEEIYKGKGE